VHRQHDGRCTRSLAALAEVAPSTRQSGKIKVVSFRWAADKQLRDAACDFAGDSRHASPCAARLYNDAIARGKDHPHAVRILARAWLYIISHCWQDGAAYDPALHKALQRILAEQNRRLDTGLLTPASYDPPAGRSGGTCPGARSR